MAVHINLLQNQKDYTKLENAFRLARVGVALLGAACLVALLVLFALKRNAQMTLAQSVAQRNLLQQNVNALQDQEVRIVLINEKMLAMNDVLAQSPDFSREVETFLAHVPISSEAAQLDRIALDGRTGSYTVSFPGVLQLSSFITAIESPAFQQQFKTIEIGTIEISDAKDSLILTLNVTY